MFMRAAIIFFILFALPAWAQEDAPEMDAEACRQIMLHRPGQDGDATYKPGVDAQGKPVVEADLNPSLPVPESYDFDIAIDVARYARLPVKRGVEPYLYAGHVNIDKDGRMLFNGAPMEGEQEAALRALCQDRNKDGSNVRIAPKPSDRSADPRRITP